VRRVGKTLSIFPAKKTSSQKKSQNVRNVQWKMILRRITWAFKPQQLTQSPAIPRCASRVPPSPGAKRGTGESSQDFSNCSPALWLLPVLFTSRIGICILNKLYLHILHLLLFVLDGLPLPSPLDQYQQQGKARDLRAKSIKEKGQCSNNRRLL